MKFDIMQSQKYLYFIHRFFQMGPAVATRLLIGRSKKRRFLKRFKHRWQKGQSYHSWDDIANAHSSDSFDVFLKHVRTHNIFQSIAQAPHFQQSLPSELRNNATLFALADKATEPTINILGYGTFHLPHSPSTWHHDITHHRSTPSQWSNAFYADITIPASAPDDLTTQQPDIKVPWQLARLQHFFTLGLAYQHAIHIHDEPRTHKYAQAFVQQTTWWIESNPFLQGVNWTNPMEVAIRGINLCWAFHHFKDVDTIPVSFWQQYFCVLYDHMIYLENNWELSDKPNNHYLADLVGYCYLSSLFVDIKFYYQKHLNVITTTLNQFRNQINHDGTCYEGSTAYHVLDTELLLHVILMCKHTGITLPEWVEHMYKTMQQFISDCTDSSGTIVHIGDDDGGYVLFPAHRTSTEHVRPVVHTYQNFGLSIIRTSTLHLTFRHPNYTSYQPSGHFHYDQLAITLSINDNPILIDAGSYVYTANAAWRNRFRDYAAHNTLFVTSAQSSFKNADNLFQLPRQEHLAPPFITKHDNIITLVDHNNHWIDQGLQAHRHVECDTHTNIITLTDWWSTRNHSTCNVSWTLHFAPTITLEQNNNDWLIKKEDHVLARCSSTLNFSIKEDFYAPTYGLRIPSYTLVAKLPVSTQTHTIIIQPFC